MKVLWQVIDNIVISALWSFDMNLYIIYSSVYDVKTIISEILVRAQSCDARVQDTSENVRERYSVSYSWHATIKSVLQYISVH